MSDEPNNVDFLEEAGHWYAPFHAAGKQVEKSAQLAFDASGIVQIVHPHGMHDACDLNDAAHVRIDTASPE